jgi:thiol:disulfide interchange protein DsbD
MKSIRFFLILLLFSGYGFANTVNTGHAEVSIIKNSATIVNKDELFIGIRMDMQNHWHTYWKNPGDSGGPLKVKWQVPSEYKIYDVQWPAPELIPYPPLMTYGYENFVIFPFKIDILEGQSLDYINANIDFLICEDICVPEQAIIKTSFQDLIIDNRIDDWVLKVPNVTLPVISSQNDNILELRFSYNEKIEDIYFYIEEKDIVLYSKEQKLIKEENNWLLQVFLEDDPDFNEVINGVISINNDSYIINSEVSYNNGTVNSLSVLQALLFAFVGGLILNLMPCVFPIISLKVLSFVSMGGESKEIIRKHSLSFCLGVVLSFIAIALVLLFLKQSGVLVGWGFQLQSPVIVGILSILMFLIGLILLTDINIGTSLTRLGKVGSNDSSYSGSFLTGILAVIVASPCTAPFMGAAIGYALIQPSAITIPIFLSLGLGFAAPYLVLSIKPELISSMPRPGKWMETLKEFFAFPMFATSLWLLWVFSMQTNTEALISLLISLLLVSLLVWSYSKLNKPYIKIFIVLIGIFMLSYQLIQISNTKIAELQSENTLKSWNENTESLYQSKNQAYLINFTAAWCITCQANDKIALSRPAVKNYLKENNIEYIVADWTNRNEEILNVLNKYGRSGVPLYVYWKPGMTESKLLPAILTEQIVLDSL